MHTQSLQTIKWNKESYLEFISMLEELGDDKYKEFNSKLIPDIGQTFGVRIPVLRKISKIISKNPDINILYNLLDEGKSYDEKLIQGMIIPKLNYSSMKELFEYVELYILRINNWALCDAFVSSLKPVITKNNEAFFIRIKKYLNSKNPWEVRFGLVLLNSYFVDDIHIKKIFSLINSVNSDNYYVNMGMAWLISTCFFVDKTLTVEFLNSNKVSLWCTNKSIQKILESKKIEENDKVEIRKLKDQINSRREENGEI